MLLQRFGFLLCMASLFGGCEKEEPETGAFELMKVFAGSSELNLSGASTNIPVDASFTLMFSSPVNKSSASSCIFLRHEDTIINTSLSFLSEDKSVVVYPTGALENSATYTLEVTGDLKGAGGEKFNPLEVTFHTAAGELKILSTKIAGDNIDHKSRIHNVPVNLEMTINFSSQINKELFKDAVSFTGSGVPGLNFSYSNNSQTVDITTTAPLKYLTKYQFNLSDTEIGTEGQGVRGLTKTLYTQLDSTYKFPEITDEELLTKVQEQTFKYFWDFAHPVSGLARERNTSANTVTIGGSGFGVMAIIVGIERGFITRQEGVGRLEKIVNFLQQADRFHGVWPHWLDGNTGEVRPFSTKDNGGDLVETAFMIQGLLTVREYLNPADQQEAAIINKITQLWEEVEWDWYTRDGQNVLYWHWSPDYGWEMNHKISGWNEALIVYVLAASSPTHSIEPEVYHEGWARSGAIKNGKEYYGVSLPLGFGYGGPLFFAHYSFLGLDPRNLEDKYANYWEQNVSHSLINWQHAVVNPNDYVGYDRNAWGFTASDNHQGYSAHSPTNDLGVITPTAALSSIPYTPEQSMDALKHFYYFMGDKLWGAYGFYDAYNPTHQWYANSYLAIDQGPIIIMIENYRTGLLWDLFMSSQEVRSGLNKLGFSY